MDAMEFIRNYNMYVEEIEMVVKPELLPILEKLKHTDPHDLISPESWFETNNHARGFVWSVFLKNIRKFQ